MLRPSLSLLMVLLTLTWLAPSLRSQPASRGLYYRHQEKQFELWIPAGFKEKKAEGKKADAKHLAEFEGGRGNAHLIRLEMCRSKSIGEFVTLTRQRSMTDFPGVDMRVFKSEGVGRLPAAICLLKYLDANVSFRGFELIEVGVHLGQGALLRILVYLPKGRSEGALEEARAMAATARQSGERGLDPFLGARRLHLATGVSYRPLLGMEESAAAAKDPRIYAGTSTPSGIALTLEKTEHATIPEAIESARGSDREAEAPWKFPHPGELELRGAVYASGDDKTRKVVVAVRKKTGPIYRLTCTGGKADEGALVRAAELVGMSLDVVDVAAARGKASTAAADLARALKKRDTSGIREQVKTLAFLTFLPEARQSLESELCRLQDPQATTEAIRALGVTRDESLLPALIKAAKYTRNQGWTDALIADLGALGQVRGPKAVPVLVKQVQRDDPEVRAAAIRALGYYVEQKMKVLKDLVRLMKKEEASGKKASPVARERWQTLEPAFKEALYRLSGETFDSARDAQKWLKRQPKA